jgi:replicative DNA helicase
MESTSSVTPFRLGPTNPPVRTPPHNDEAEMALLGALLLNNRAIEQVGDFLRPEHFASRVHGRIFEAIQKLIERGQIADPITLKQYFENDSDLTEIGGYAYLIRLAGSVVSVINSGDYGRTIYDLYLRRQLVQLGEEIVNEAFQEELEPDGKAQIEGAAQKLFSLASSGDLEGGFQSFS